MKKQKNKRIKSRHARILFDKDSPFKHQVVRDRTKFKRKEKYPRKDGDFFYPIISIV